MAKKKVNCGRCGREFFSTITKVFVFQIRLCPKCKFPCNVTNNEIFTCPKCNGVYKKGDVEFGAMGVEMKGSSRSREGMLQATKDPTFAYTIVFVPENHYCQRCRNMQSRYEQLMKNQQRKKNKITELPKEITDADIYRYEVAKLHQKEFQEAQQKKMSEEKQKQLEESKQKVMAEKLKELSENNKDNKNNKEEKKDGTGKSES